MTLSSQTQKVIYNCNGSQTVFPYTFKIFEDTEVEVILYTVADGTETTLSLTTHYTVSDAGEESGGNITTVSTYSSAYQLIIRRNLPYTQETDYIANDPFPAETHEEALDKLTMLILQQKEITDRSIVQASTETSIIQYPSGEANKILGWNSAGTGLENKDLADSVLPDAVQGDILFYTGTAWDNLAAGTDGYYLKTQGAGANPIWATISSNGTEIADADDDTKIQVEKSADEDIIRFDLGNATLSAAREVLTLQAIDANDVKLEPTTDDDVDLGSASKEFKDLYIDGTANIDSLVADTADINAGTVNGLTSFGMSSGADITEIEDNDSLGTSDTKLCTQGNVKAYVDTSVGNINPGIDRISTTTMSASTNSGNITISQDVAYLVVFRLENDINSDTTISLRFNSDGTANYSNVGESTGSSPSNEIDMCVMDQSGDGGFAFGSFKMDTINTDMMAISGDITYQDTNAAIQRADICGHWDASTTVTDFEIVANQNINGEIILYRYNTA